MVYKMALAYAAKGWLVMPLHTVQAGVCGCRKPACKSPGKHPLLADGLHGASSDPTKILEWWGDEKTISGRYQGANIGIRTGNCSRLFVVDVDGPEAIKDFEGFMAGCSSVPVWRVLTGRTDQDGNRSGCHWYFDLAEGQQAPPNSQGVIGPHIDVRGEGGYVVAPPSIHVSGRLYVAAEEETIRE
jgi:putative DNA primase/helicase